MTWLIDRGRPAEAADIAWGLKYFWLIRGHAAEGLRWYEQILSQPSLPPAAESRALAWSGGDVVHARRPRARPRRARPRARARSRCERPGDDRACRGSPGARRTRRWQRERGPRSIRPQCRGFRALAIPSGTGNALSGMAVRGPRDRRRRDAERLLDEAAMVLRHAGPWFLTWALYVRAILAVRRGKPR